LSENAVQKHITLLSKLRADTRADFGYQSHRAPYINSFGMYFALIKDPDGNMILLSAD